MVHIRGTRTLLIILSDSSKRAADGSGVVSSGIALTITTNLSSGLNLSPIQNFYRRSVCVVLRAGFTKFHIAVGEKLSWHF